MLEVSQALQVDSLVLGQTLVDQLAVWEFANPGQPVPTSVYDDTVAMVMAAAAPAAGPTPGNVRITRVLAATLGTCAALACPPPNGIPYRGGAHVCTSQPRNDQKDSHRIPADPATAMPAATGPAIQMDPVDHRMTHSYGGRATGPGYAPQRAMIANGNAIGAILADVADVRQIVALSGDPTKYDAAIAQMLAYAGCLQAAGLLR